MTHNPHQPREYDIVLGGPSAPEGALVLGGIEGIKQRLGYGAPANRSQTCEERVSALREGLKYGDAGIDLVIETLQNESGEVLLAAYTLLQDLEKSLGKPVLFEDKLGAYEIRKSYAAGKRNFIRVNLSGAYLISANLKEVVMIGANLKHINLWGANLSGAELMDANLMDAELSGANLSGANLIGANLIGANLIGANLKNAKLMGASLWNASLSNANLSHANLSNANLSNANLKDAHLRSANLSGANLKGASLCSSGFPYRKPIL